MSGGASERITALAAALSAVLDNGTAGPPAASEGPAMAVNAAPYVTIRLAAAITGLSEKAIERKIDEGIWVEGREWLKGPDGRRYVSVRGFQAWVERGGGRAPRVARGKGATGREAGAAAATPKPPLPSPLPSPPPPKKR